MKKFFNKIVCKIFGHKIVVFEDFKKVSRMRNNSIKTRYDVIHTSHCTRCNTEIKKERLEKISQEEYLRRLYL